MAQPGPIVLNEPLVSIKDHDDSDSESTSESSVTKQVKASVPFNQKLYLYLVKRKIDWVIELVVVCLSIIWVGFYVASTYLTVYPSWLRILDYVFATLFLFVFLFNLYIATERVKFLYSVYSIVDYFTIFPAYFELPESLLVLRVLATLRIFRLTRLFNLISSSYIRKITEIVLSICIFIFISANLILVVEEDTFKNFHTSLYFLIVTVTTVGYGDFHPNTTPGQLLMMVIILFSFVFLPLQGYFLIQTISKNRNRPRVEWNNTPHVILTGHITAISLQAFLREFFHERTDSLNYSVIILDPTELSQACKDIIGSPQYYKQIFVFQGDPLNKDDLRTVDLEKAVACFVLTDLFTDNCQDTDKETVFRCFSVRSASQEIKIHAQIHRREHQSLLETAGVNVVCLDTLKYGIIGHSINVPGFSNLISQIISCSETNVSNKYPGQNSIYFASFSPHLRGYSFTEAAAVLYQLKGVILIAVFSEDHGIFANPGTKYIIVGNEKAICLSAHPEAVYETERAATPAQVQSKIESFRSSIKELSSRGDSSSEDEKVSSDSSVPSPTMQSPRSPKAKREDSDNFLSSPRAGRPDFIRKSDSKIDVLYSKSISLTNHIIVCGNPTECTTFISYLQAKGNKDPVLILTSCASDVWKKFSSFPSTVVAQGNPFKESDLNNINIKQCKNIVIFRGFDERPEVPVIISQKDSKGSFSHRTQYRHNSAPLHLDRNTILAYMNIKLRIAQETPVLMELASLVSLGVVHHNTNPRNYKEYQRGSVYEDSFCSTVSAQTFLEPLKVDVAYQLFENHQALKLIPVPMALIGKSYGELVMFLLAQYQQVALGLFKVQSNDLSYVWSHPSRGLVLSKSDRVYVLSNQETANK